MIIDRHPDWSQTVRENWTKTTAFLLASAQPCIAIRDEEVRAIKANRVLVGLSASDLEAWHPPSSWMLAVLVCPGDTTLDVTAWVRSRKADPRRVHFFLHPGTKWGALDAWADAGFPIVSLDDDIASWERLHKRLGLALSDRIVADWG